MGKGMEVQHDLALKGQVTVRARQIVHSAGRHPPRQASVQHSDRPLDWLLVFLHPVEVKPSFLLLP